MIFFSGVPVDVAPYIQVKDFFPDTMRGMIWSIIKAIYSFGTSMIQSISSILQLNLVGDIFNENWEEIQLLCWAILFLCFVIFMIVKMINPTAYKNYVRQLIIAVTVITCMGYVSGMVQQGLSVIGEYSNDIAMRDNPFNTIVTSQTFDIKKSVEAGRMISIKESDPLIVGTSLDVLKGTGESPLNFKIAGYDLNGNVRTEDLEISWITLGSLNEKVYLYDFNGTIIILSSIAVTIAVAFSLWKVLKIFIEVSVMPLWTALAVSSDTSGNRTKKAIEIFCQSFVTLFITLFMFKIFTDLLMYGGGMEGMVALFYYIAICGFMVSGSSYFAKLTGVDTDNNNLLGSMLKAQAIRGAVRTVGNVVGDTFSKLPKFPRPTTENIPTIDSLPPVGKENVMKAETTANTDGKKSPLAVQKLDNNLRQVQNSTVDNKGSAVEKVSNLSKEKQKDRTENTPSKQEAVSFMRNEEFSNGSNIESSSVEKDIGIDTVNKENMTSTDDKQNHIERMRDKAVEQKQKSEPQQREEQSEMKAKAIQQENFGKKNIIRPKKQKDDDDDLDLGLMYQKKKKQREGNHNE